MKNIAVLVTALFGLSSTASERLCLSTAQAQFRPSSYPTQIRLEQSESNPNQVRFFTANGSTESDLIYKDSGETLQPQQVRFSCRKRAEDLLRARLLVAIESLKLNSSVALILLLQTGMSGDYSTSCGILEESKVMTSLDPKTKDFLGSELLMSFVEDQRTILEYGYGLVYSTRFCR